MGRCPLFLWRKGGAVERLVCDRCDVVYDDHADIQHAKAHVEQWSEMCRQDGVEPRGIIPCPNIRCPGELMLKDD